MAINFPDSPVNGDTHVVGNVTYVYNNAKNKWVGAGQTPIDRLVEGSNSLELDANNDLVYTAPGTLKVNSADASGYIAEFNQTNTSNSGQILINSPTNDGSRPVLLDMARAGTLQWSLGQGYNDTSGAFHISTTSLASGFSNSKFSVRTDGEVRISGPNSTLLVSNQTSNDNQTIANFKGNDDVNQAGLIVRYYQCGSNDNRAGLYWQHENVGNMRMWMGDDLRLRMSGSNPTSANAGNAFVQEDLSTTNNIKMGDGYGIDFSATTDPASGMTSELLDDYEEGDWTPLLRGRTTAGTTVNNRLAVGKYTKVGRMVNVVCDIDQTCTGGTGDMQIGGLPYAAHTGPYVRFMGAIHWERMPFAYSDVQLVAFLNDNNDYVWIGSSRSNTTGALMNITSNQTAMQFSITYMTD